MDPKDVEYYHTIGRSAFLEFANALGAATGEKIEVKGNRLALPPSLATGRLEYYGLKPGFAMAIINCVFNKSVRMRQLVIAGSDGYKVLFNASDKPVYIKGHIVNSQTMGSSLADAVFFTSYTTGADIDILRGQHIKIVALYFRHDWGIKYMMQNPFPVRVSRMKQFANYEQMQFSSSLDLKSQGFIEEVLSVKAPKCIMPRLLEGYAYQLMALFFNNLVEEDTYEKRVVSEDAMRILQLKEQLEQNLEEPIPPIEEAAEKCLLSRTKFVRMFRELFQKNYGVFFMHRKLEWAKGLLDQDCTVMDAAYKIGYSNVSQFVKAFRLYYGITPGVYRQQIKTTAGK